VTDTHRTDAEDVTLRAFVEHLKQTRAELRDKLTELVDRLDAASPLSVIARNAQHDLSPDAAADRVWSDPDLSEIERAQRQALITRFLGTEDRND
jgi:hypothetical protein